jgi:hypothetical protein
MTVLSAPPGPKQLQQLVLESNRSGFGDRRDQRPSAEVAASGRKLDEFVSIGLTAPPRRLANAGRSPKWKKTAKKAKITRKA